MSNKLNLLDADPDWLLWLDEQLEETPAKKTAEICPACAGSMYGRAGLDLTLICEDCGLKREWEL